MAVIYRLFIIGLLSAGIGVATAAQAGNQLFEGSWSVKARGNERAGGTGESASYSAWGRPLGILCNPNQPRCPFDSTPTNGTGMFAPLGGKQTYALFCAPWANWQGNGTTARPARSQTASYPMGQGPIPPLYRNPRFFTSGGEPDTNACTAASTGATPGGKGLAQAGQPIVGSWSAVTTGTQKGGFHFAAAPKNHAAGIRTTGQVGSFPSIYPYVYSYTYATLRNDAGFFGPGLGLGNFNQVYTRSAKAIASIHVRQGAAKFGGTMRMLGALASKACYYRNGGCSVLEWNGRYDAIGTSAFTSKGVVTAGYRAFWANYGYVCYPPALCLRAYGYRFPWTTGSVTVTATGRGSHHTVHYAHGYDNRNTTTPSGKGTIQLVSPVLTQWLHPARSFQTAGIGILRIKFVPEPQAWVMLVAGALLLGVGTRMRGC